jgi:hypothetical protein
MKLQSIFSRMGKRIAIAAAFGALCFAMGAPSAQAEDRNPRQTRVEISWNNARDNHGYYGRRDNDRRRDLDQERERRWNQTRYRNDRDDRWQNSRNWDRDDRDANHDRDDRNRDRDDNNRYRDGRNFNSQFSPTR